MTGAEGRWTGSVWVAESRELLRQTRMKMETEMVKIEENGQGEKMIGQEEEL